MKTKMKLFIMELYNDGLVPMWLVTCLFRMLGGLRDD